MADFEEMLNTIQNNEDFSSFAVQEYLIKEFFTTIDSTDYSEDQKKQAKTKYIQNHEYKHVKGVKQLLRSLVIKHNLNKPPEPKKKQEEFQEVPIHNLKYDPCLEYPIPKATVDEINKSKRKKRKRKTKKEDPITTLEEATNAEENTSNNLVICDKEKEETDNNTSFNVEVIQKNNRCLVSISLDQEKITILRGQKEDLIELTSYTLNNNNIYRLKEIDVDIKLKHAVSLKNYNLALFYYFLINLKDLRSTSSVLDFYIEACLSGQDNNEERSISLININ